MICDPSITKVDIDKLSNAMQPKQNLKVFLVSRRADWCEDNAIAVLAIDKLHAERCARCNSDDFRK